MIIWSLNRTNDNLVTRHAGNGLNVRAFPTLKKRWVICLKNKNRSSGLLKVRFLLYFAIRRIMWHKLGIFIPMT